MLGFGKEVKLMNENRPEETVEKQCRKVICKETNTRSGFMIAIVLFILLAIIIGARRTY